MINFGTWPRLRIACTDRSEIINAKQTAHVLACFGLMIEKLLWGHINFEEWLIYWSLNKQWGVSARSHPKCPVLVCSSHIHHIASAGHRSERAWKIIGTGARTLSSQCWGTIPTCDTGDHPIPQSGLEDLLNPGNDVPISRNRHLSDVLPMPRAASSKTP